MSFSQALHDLVFSPGIEPAVPRPTVALPKIEELRQLADAHGTYGMLLRCDNCGLEVQISVPRTCTLENWAMNDCIIHTPNGTRCPVPYCPRCETKSLRKVNP